METLITLAMAKRDFAHGFCKGCRIERAAFNHGWHVLVIMHSQNWLIVDARGKQARVFKTLDAALHVVEDIGFRVDALSV